MTTALSPTGLDDTGDLQAALNAGGVIYLAPGFFHLTSKITIPSYGTRLIGSGKAATVLCAAKDCLQVGGVGGGKEDIVLNSIENLAITSADQTTQKTAITVVGASQLLLRDVEVNGWQGAGSVGLLIQGHNAGRVQNCDFIADCPISIKANPNSPYQHGGATIKEDLDHWSFSDLFLVAGEDWPCVQIASGLVISNLLFDGDQAWVGGRAGLEWIDTACQQIGLNLKLCNVRWEETYNSQGFFANIQHNHGLQKLTLVDCWVSSGQGLYLRRCSRTRLTGFTYAATDVGLDVDSGYGLEINGDSLFQPGSVLNLGKELSGASGAYWFGEDLVRIS